MVAEKIYIADKPTQDQIKQGVDNISAQIVNKNASKILKSKTYTSNGTFTVPAGVTEVYLTGGGGGGGGGCGQSAPGNSGGVTSFGSLKSLTGGGGATINANGGTQGGAGGAGGAYGVNNTTGINGSGGGSGFFHGGLGGSSGSTNGAYCSGGSGTWYNSVFGGGGGGADFIIDFPVTVTPNTSISITIGNGGNGGSYNGNTAGHGGKGLLIVKWWE